MVFSRKITMELIKSIEDAVASKYPSTLDHAELLQNIYAELDQTAINAADDALRVFFLIILALESAPLANTIKEKDRDKLYKMAQNCLRASGILPIKSQHSHLYTRLHESLARLSLLDARVWDSVGSAMVGEYLGRDSTLSNEIDLLLRSRQAWQLGHIKTAKVALHTLDMQQENLPLHRRQESMHLLLKAYRLSGEADQALLLCRLDQDEASENPAWARLMRFESMLCEITTGADCKDLAQYLNETRNELEPLLAEIGQLWLFASPYRGLWRELQTGSKRSKKARASSNMPQLARMLQTLESLYDQDIPLQKRLESLAECLSSNELQYDPEWRQLFLAASIRWLTRSRQTTFASILKDEYTALSIKYSDGQKTDTLGLIGDLAISLPVVVERAAVKHQEYMYTGPMPRFLRLAKVMGKAAYRASGLLLRPLPPAEYRQQRKQVFKEFLDDFEKALGDFKGPAMKIAQMLAASCFVGEEIQDAMIRIYDEAEPIPLSGMTRSLDADGLPPLDTLFASIEPMPIAVASIGEVFKAVLPDGSRVAVKIMYPDIDKVIDADMLLLRLFTPIFRQFIRKDTLAVGIEQVKARLHDECDYNRESAHQESMRELLADETQIVIPRVHKDISTRHMLVSEFVSAERLDQFIQHANLEQRNHIARLLVRYWVLTTVKHGFMHIDPHLGNFLVDGDRLVVLDFGACMVVPPTLVQLFRDVLVCKYRQEFPAMYEHIARTGIVTPGTMSLEDFMQGPARLFASYHENRVRKIYEEGEASLFQFVVQHRLTKRVGKDVQKNFFALIVLAQFEEVLARTEAEFNWHHMLGELLLELGMITADEVQPAATALA